MNILWAARWEHDKNPEDFFAAIGQLETQGVEFGLNVIGERFADSPPIFDAARKQFEPRIGRWGFQPSRAEYLATLQKSDVIVSTANHEFFGIAVVEAIAAGVRPLLPHRLSYPEILALKTDPSNRMFCYDGSVESLAERLFQLAEQFQNKDKWRDESSIAKELVAKYLWPNCAAMMDQELSLACNSST